MRIAASVDSKRVEKVLARTPNALEIELYNALRDIGERQLSEMGARMERGRIGPAIGGGLVRTSTGKLRRSFVRVGPQQGGGIGGLRMKLFSAGVNYANIQEFGGTIRPVKGRFLAVPMPAIRRPNGSIVGKYSGGPRSLMGQLGSDGKPLTFVWRNPLGGAFIVERLPNGKLKFLWKLARSVTLKGGLGWFDTWRAGREERAERIRRAGTLAIERARTA